MKVAKTATPQCIRWQSLPKPKIHCFLAKIPIVSQPAIPLHPLTAVTFSSSFHIYGTNPRQSNFYFLIHTLISLLLSQFDLNNRMPFSKDRHLLDMRRPVINVPTFQPDRNLYIRPPHSHPFLSNSQSTHFSLFHNPCQGTVYHTAGSPNGHHWNNHRN